MDNNLGTFGRQLIGKKLIHIVYIIWQTGNFYVAEHQPNTIHNYMIAILSKIVRAGFDKFRNSVNNGIAIVWHSILGSNIVLYIPG